MGVFDSLYFLSLFGALAFGASCPARSEMDWRAFKGNGANLGGWLVQEEFIDTQWWERYPGNATDEWELCVHLGHQCGKVLEERYRTFIQKHDIDTLGRAGVKVLRIPTHYAAWVEVPGSQLYSGNQVGYLDRIAQYAIRKYNMHIIVDLHSLPGGVNGQGHGERDGGYNWFFNETALDYSYQAVDAAVRYIQSSGSPGSYSVAPINEPVTNPDMSLFGTPQSLSDDGAAWVLKYILGVLERVGQATGNHKNRIPVVFQGGFRPVSEWAAKLPANANLVFDVHNYYFAGRGVNQSNVAEYIAEDAANSVDPENRFPSFVGEWSIELESGNTLDDRKDLLTMGFKEFSNWTQGSAYWTAKCLGTGAVAGEGTKRDYWSLESFINLGLINSI